MSLKLTKQKKPRAERRTVQIDNEDGVSIVVREPKPEELFGQWLWSAGSLDRLALYRTRVVVDWSGVVSDEVDEKTGQPKPIPFSREWLMEAIRRNENMQVGVFVACRQAFEGIPEQDEKNSGAPSVTGLADGSELSGETTATAGMDGKSDPPTIGESTCGQNSSVPSGIGEVASVASAVAEIETVAA